MSAPHLCLHRREITKQVSDLSSAHPRVNASLKRSSQGLLSPSVLPSPFPHLGSGSPSSIPDSFPPLWLSQHTENTAVALNAAPPLYLERSVWQIASALKEEIDMYLKDSFFKYVELMGYWIKITRYYGLIDWKLPFSIVQVQERGNPCLYL